MGKRISWIRTRKVLLTIILFFFFIHAGEQNVIAAGIQPTVHDDTTVRVYLTVSYDSEFLRAGNNADPGKRTGKVLARVPVDISYVDLAEYGLEDYYRYEANDFDERGEYKNSTIVVQPTVLMLFLRSTSLYYLDREIQASDIGSDETEHKDALTLSGGPTHLYFKKFWGHGENLMYYVNHKFPYQSAGWGATADYILLEDGDEIDVAMFSNMSFNQFGAFESFEETEYQAVPGEEITLRLLASDTTENGKVLEPEPSESIRISSDYGETWQETGIVTDSNGNAKVRFEEPGIYYVSAGPDFIRNVKNEMKCVAPPISVVQVTPKTITDIRTFNPTENTVKCTWENQGNNVIYSVDYRTTGDTVWKTATISEPQITVDDVDPVRCEFRIRAAVISDYVPYGEQPKTIKSAYSKVARHPGFVPEPDPAAKLNDAITNAISAIETYIDPSLYRNEEKRQIAAIIAETRENIGNCTTADEVEAVLVVAKERLNALKTDLNYTKEEQKALTARIKAAKAAKPAVKVKALAKHKAKITWGKVRLSYIVDKKKFTGAVTGYKIYRATKKNGKYKLIKTIKKADTLKYTDKRLKKGKKYYYKVRAYTRIDGKTYLGKWSKVRKITAK